MKDFFEVGKGDMDSICFYKADDFEPKKPLDVTDIYALRYFAMQSFADTEVETWEEFDHDCAIQDSELYLGRFEGLHFGLADEDCEVYMANLKAIAINKYGRPAVDIWFGDEEHYWYWFE